MHRTKNVVRLAAWGLLCAGLASAGANLALAQDAVPAGGQANLPGSRGGSAALIVAVNSSQKLSMSTRKPIRSVINEKETVARIQALASDPTSVLVVGIAAGSTRVTLTDVDGRTENVDVLVQLDIDAVKSVIRLAFPTANVTPIAAGTNVIVLTGNVSHPEEIESIVRVAQGVLGQVGTAAAGPGGTSTQVVNAMNVGGPKQVQLDVTIASVNRTESRRRNASFVIDGNTVSAASVLPGLINASPASQAIAGTGVGIRPQPATAQPLLTTGTAGANLIFGIVPSNFAAFIQALRVEGLAKFLAEPKLVTMSGRPARFLAGGRQAVLGPSSGINGPGVVYENIGTELQFLPIVLSNGRIYLDVAPTVRNVNNALGISTVFGFVPGFDEQSIQTSVQMDAGQTFAVGGLIQTQTIASATKFPCLGDMPYIGMAFSSIDHQEVEQELVILVTPYLVDAMDCKQAPCKLPGMETRKPDDFEVFLESILEAPRGHRDIYPDKRTYVPAWKHDSTHCQFPCGGDRTGCSPVPTCGANGGNCNTGGCATGNCGTPAVQAPVAAPVTQARYAPAPAGVQQTSGQR